MLQSVIIFIHALLALAIIGFVLMQKGKGADAGAGFGSGASGTVFGARGSATFLSKTTAILATCFFITSLSLAYMAAHREVKAPSSVLDAASTPVVPATGPAPLTLPSVPAPLDAPPAAAPAAAPAPAAPAQP